MNRINDKIEEVESYLEELSEIIPENFKEYKINFETRAACERYFEKIITATLKERLQEARGMRNIIAHEYGILDNELVFESIKREIIPDTERFLDRIKEFLETGKD